MEARKGREPSSIPEQTEASRSIRGEEYGLWVMSVDPKRRGWRRRIFAAENPGEALAKSRQGGMM
jgi:hypothetical protein